RKIARAARDEAGGRAALSDEMLRGALGPLVHLVAMSARVTEAAIIPVTAFGFGNAVLREEGGGREGTTTTTPADPFGPEAIWLLREGMPPQPFNLDTLVICPLLFGLLEHHRAS